MKKKEFLKELNRRSYEAIASEFHETRQQPWKELFDLTAGVRDGFSVADLGCGNGRLLKALPKVNFTYVGVDSNEFLLDRARGEFPGVKFIRAELPDAPLVPDSFNMIFCIATFHHLVDADDRHAFLSLCFKALKPGGSLIMSNWSLWSHRDFWELFFSRLSWKIAWNDMIMPWHSHGKVFLRYYHCFTRYELRRLLRAAGFSSLSFELHRQAERGANLVVRAVK